MFIHARMMDERQAFATGRSSVDLQSIEQFAKELKER
jgi:hypothetical protein